MLLASPFKLVGAGLRRLWRSYSLALDQHPLRTKAATAFVIFTTADSIRQRIESYQRALSEVKTSSGASPSTPNTQYFVWDAQRTFRLSVFYAVVHAPWVHHWFALLDRVLGKTTAVRVVATKVVADQLISMPVFMTTLLASQALLAGHDLSYCRAKLQRDLLPTIQGAWMCWIPALVVAFTFVPLKFRPLYVNCVQVAFGVWISKQANAPLHPPPTQAATAAGTAGTARVIAGTATTGTAVTTGAAAPTAVSPNATACTTAAPTSPTKMEGRGPTRSHS